MAGRPYWSGQLKISLVSFGIQLFPATNVQSGIRFHQIDRATGQRIRHSNVTEDKEPVDNSEIVKGYEYSKGKYLVVEPDEIARLRIETQRVLNVKQFVSLNELAPVLFEKPYFVVPEPKDSADAYAVVRKAMERTGKAAVGEIAFAGREHLVAIAAPSDQSQPVLMAYLLRYAEELRKSENYLPELSQLHSAEVDKKQLELATQLIDTYSRPFHLDEFKDDYEDALRKLIEAKQKNAPLPLEEEIPKPGKVINLMDALRESLSHAKQPVAGSRREAKAPPKKRPAREKGPVLVGAAKRKRTAA